MRKIKNWGFFVILFAAILFHWYARKKAKSVSTKQPPLTRQALPVLTHARSAPLLKRKRFIQKRYLRILQTEQSRQLQQKIEASLKIIQSREALGRVEQTNAALAYFMLERWAPKLFGHYRLKKRLDSALRSLSNRPIEDAVLRQLSPDNRMDPIQAILDLWYMTKLRGMPIARPTQKELKWMLKVSKKTNLLYSYIFSRVLREVGAPAPPFFSPDVLWKKMSAKGEQIFGYYLTHILLYDSAFLRRPPPNIQPQKILKAFAALLPWVLKNKDADLGGEIFICLLWLKQGHLPMALRLKELLLKEKLSDDEHQNVVLLVALGRLLEPYVVMTEESTLDVKGGKLWVQLSGRDKKGIPLIAINGGPGWSHHVIAPVRPLAKDRPVLLYDQLGTGRSSKPTNAALWSLARYLDELTTLIETMGWPKVSLLGHSWGAMLAVDYALKSPKKTHKLLLASPVISARRWMADATTLRKQLPPKIQTLLRLHERRGTTSSKEYQQAEQLYTRRFVAPPSPFLHKLFEHADFNEQIYSLMWGPYEFQLTGNLRSYERVERLHELKMPVLWSCGRMDEATPGALKEFARKIPGSRTYIFEKSAHITYLQEQSTFLRVVGEFLREHPQKRRGQ